ncbi:response regulator [Indioceanicola profundi]|uniref:response regulator n=1 Tax=Indioceanicola profundi TaxID=2220096 RepID=UPI000E6AAB92|nr:response regulator [Indioceanicola profundi]
MARVLVVEDEALIGMALAVTLVDGGHKVCGPVPSVDAALREAARCRPDVALVDVRLKGTATGLELTPKLAAMGVRCVIMSAHTTRREAEESGAVGWLPKPCSSRAVLAAVAQGASAPDRRGPQAAGSRRDQHTGKVFGAATT